MKLLSEYKNIFCIGIGGIGVSSLAKFFKAHGATVSGSDLRKVEDKDMDGMTIFVGHDASHVTKDFDLIVHSPDIPLSNPELVRAHELGITTFDYPTVLGMVMATGMGIAVSGTNGKTTTTALLGLILERAKKDPTVIVGGKLREWHGNFRLGQGAFILAERCEYKRNFLKIESPHMVVLTNIEEDHLDYYKDIDDIISAFREYVTKIPEVGTLVYNAADKYTKDVLDAANCEKISYGYEVEADVRGHSLMHHGGEQSFVLEWQGTELGRVSLRVPGIFNVENALAAIAAALTLGISFSDIENVLAHFYGTWRRFETIGEKNGKVFLSDYGHHPTALLGTYKAAQEFFPHKRILLVFQPHHKDRTRKLFKDFTESFLHVKHLILVEIFQVAGREHDDPISSQDFLPALKECGYGGKVLYAENFESLQKIMHEEVNNADVVIFMGAGDIDSFARKFVSHY